MFHGAIPDSEVRLPGGEEARYRPPTARRPSTAFPPVTPRRAASSLEVWPCVKETGKPEALWASDRQDVYAAAIVGVTRQNRKPGRDARR